MNTARVFASWQWEIRLTLIHRTVEGIFRKLQFSICPEENNHFVK